MLVFGGIAIPLNPFLSKLKNAKMLSSFAIVSIIAFAGLEFANNTITER